MTDRTTHLEFIERIIDRQARNTFQIKAWTITLLIGLAGLGRASRRDIFVVGVGGLVIFWTLDAYYLSKERKFRALYNDVRKKRGTDFSMDISSYKNWKCNWAGCLFALAVIVPYGAMMVGLVIFNFVLR